MEVYEYNVLKEKQKARYKKGEAIVDEDGFTLVTRGGAYGKTLGGDVGVASKRFQRSVGEGKKRGQKKKEKKEKEGFYSFQKAEKQRAGLFSLFCGSFWIGLICLLYRIVRVETEVGRGQGEGRKTQGVEKIQALLNLIRSVC
jgi:hypothetical protein